MKRTWHKPANDPRNPVLKPETPLEKGGADGRNAAAVPHFGGVWYDGTDNFYKCFYCAGWSDGLAYATSKDGIVWERPKLQPEGGGPFIAGTRRYGDWNMGYVRPNSGICIVVGDELRFYYGACGRPGRQVLRRKEDFRRKLHAHGGRCARGEQSVHARVLINRRREALFLLGWRRGLIPRSGCSLFRNRFTSSPVCRGVGLVEEFKELPTLQGARGCAQKDARTITISFKGLDLAFLKLSL